MKGSPVYPNIQTHIGVWLTTRHSVLEPHEPGQGFLHFLLMQANCVSHSLLLTHSGLQFGGDPVKSARQEHEGKLFIASHRAFGPHGELSQGLMGVTGLAAKEK